MRVAFLTFGCKVNQYESEAMAQALERAGWELATVEEADLIVINTCVVTAKAEAEARKALRRAKRTGAKVVVAGCWPQLDPQGPLQLGADGALGNEEKAEIVAVVERVLQGEQVLQVGDISEAEGFPFLPLDRPRFRTRALLKIQEGCDARCAYCVVPLVRGRPRSLPLEEVLRALQGLAREGIKEVVLTGVHLGRWGKDLRPPLDLVELLRRIETAETPPRIRLSSVEPQEISQELIALLASSEKLCPHLHVPLQSGSERVLKAMGRPYTPSQFRDLIHRIVGQLPGVAVGTDLIVGFPSEDEEAFSETYRLVEALPLAYLHVFPFSVRPGTEAAGLPGRVDERLKRQRVRALRELGQRKRREFYSRFLGERLSVLVEGKEEGGLLTGLSRNYLRCLIAGAEGMVGEEVEVEVKGLQGERALCEVLSYESRSPTPSKAGTKRV